MMWRKKPEPNYDHILANAMAHRQVMWVNRKIGLISVYGYVWQVLQRKKDWAVMLENNAVATISNQGAVYLAAHLGQVDDVVLQ